MPYSDPDKARKCKREFARRKRAQKLGRTIFEEVATMTQENTRNTDLSPCPVILERKRLGLSRLDLAQAAGLSYTQVCALEAGHPAKLSRRLRAVFSAMGTDVEALESKYSAWRGERGRSIISGARRGS